MRDRLIELIIDAIPSDTSIECLPDVYAIADHLLAAGVIVPPCKVGDVGYYISGIHGTLIKEAKIEEIYYGESGYTYFSARTSGCSRSRSRWCRQAHRCPISTRRWARYSERVDIPRNSSRICSERWHDGFDEQY